MGYELYITRAESFWGTQEDPIAEEEWLAVASADSDLQLDMSSYLNYETAMGEIKQVHPWILTRHPDRPPFWFRDGAIFTTNPDTRTIAKMIALAKNLNAQVIGEEGEVYETVAADDHEAIRNSKNKRLKRFLLRLLGILALLLVSILFCWSLPRINMGINNFRANHFARPLFNYPLPPETIVISRFAEVSRAGGGNHCDFVAFQEMESALSKEAILEYYQDVSFPRVLGSIYPAPAPHLIDFDERSPNGESMRFTFVLFDANQPPGIDLRCN